MMSNQTPKVVLIAAIAAIAAMQGWALYNGHNGMLMATCIGAIGLLAGIALPQLKLK